MVQLRGFVGTEAFYVKRGRQRENTHTHAYTQAEVSEHETFFPCQAARQCFFLPSLHPRLIAMDVFLPFLLFFPLLCMMQTSAADKVCKVEAMFHTATGGCVAAYFNAILILVQQIGEKILI